MTEEKKVIETEFPLEKLNQRQRKFCLHYHLTGKGKQSAIMAGYKEDHAATTASNLLDMPQVQAKLHELREHIEKLALDEEEGTVMTELERKQRLSEIGRGRLVDFVNVDDDELEINLNGKNDGALQEVSIESWHGGKDQRAQSRASKVKLRDPVSAIQELNRMDKTYDQPPERPGLVQTFVFVMPDGTRVSPSEMKPKQVEG